jgi:hypothetical protein
VEDLYSFVYLLHILLVYLCFLFFSLLLGEACGHWVVFVFFCFWVCFLGVFVFRHWLVHMGFALLPFAFIFVFVVFLLKSCRMAGVNTS